MTHAECFAWDQHTLVTVMRTADRADYIATDRATGRSVEGRSLRHAVDRLKGWR